MERVMMDKYFLANIFEKIGDHGMWVSSINKLWKEKFDRHFPQKENSYTSISSMKRLRYLIQTKSIALHKFAEFLAKKGSHFRMFKYILTHLETYQVLDLLDRASSYKSKYFVKLIHTLNDRDIYYYIPNCDVNYNSKLFETYSSIYGINLLENDCLNFIYTALVNHNFEVLNWFKKKEFLNVQKESVLHFICDFSSESDEFITVLKWVHRSFGEKILMERNLYLYKAIEFKSLESLRWIFSLYSFSPLRKGCSIDIYRIYSYYDSDLLYDPEFDQDYWDAVFGLLQI